MGQPQQALLALNEALPLLQAAAAKPNSSVATRVALADALKEAGLVQLDLGDINAAAAQLQEAREKMRAAQAGITPAWAEASLGLARAKQRAGKTDEAAALAREVNNFWQGFDAQNPAATAACALAGQIQGSGASKVAPPC